MLIISVKLLDTRYLLICGSYKSTIISRRKKFYKNYS